jgi:hypothetical protein
VECVVDIRPEWILGNVNSVGQALSTSFIAGWRLVTAASHYPARSFIHLGSL